MPYISIDELNCFEFHDAELKKIEFNNGNMVWDLCMINSTTKNSQNVFPTAMCINQAKIVFESVKIIGIMFGAYQVYDSNNVLIKDVEARHANYDEIDSILQETFDGYCYIFDMEIMPADNDCKYVVCCNINGGAGSYYFTFEFTKSIVQWDEFGEKAWYEDEKWKNINPK